MKLIDLTKNLTESESVRGIRCNGNEAGRASGKHRCRGAFDGCIRQRNADDEAGMQSERIA